MPVNVIDTIKPKNNGSFPVVEAVDVAVSDELRLPEALAAKADASALDDTNDALALKADTSVTTGLQNQIDQIVISASSEAVVAPEVASARVGADGTSYSTLKDRLDAETDRVLEDLSNVSGDIKYALNIPALTLELENAYTLISDKITFEAGKTYQIQISVNASVTNAIVSINSGQQSSGAIETFISYKSLIPGIYRFRFTAPANLPSILYLRVYLDNDITKCDYAEIDSYKTVFDKLPMVDENRSDINTIETVLDKSGYSVANALEGLSFTTGYYINQNGATVENSGFKYSDPIHLTQGAEIDVYAKAGSAGAVSMLYLCSSTGTFIKRLHLSSTNDYESIVYTATDDCYVALCYQIAATESKAMIYVMPEFMQDGKKIEGIETTLQKGGYSYADALDGLTFTEGYYVNQNGVKNENGGYKYSAPFFLKQGAEFDMYAKGGSPGVISMLYLCKSNGDFIKRLHLSSTSGYETIKYTADEDCYVAMCYQIASTETTASIYGLPYSQKDISGYLTASMFTDIAVCGDSYSAGSIFDSSGFLGDFEKCSWGKVMERISGASVSLYASRGADTNTWQSREICLPKLLEDDPHQVYMLCLGINDKQYVSLGTIEDITSHESYTEYPNTYYGNYGKIIEQIQAHAPNAKIIMCKLFTVAFENGSYYWASEANEEIASHYGIPCIDTADSDFLKSNMYELNMIGGHPTAPLYSGMGKAMYALFSKCIEDNLQYFEDFYIS